MQMGTEFKVVICLASGWLPKFFETVNRVSRKLINMFVVVTFQAVKYAVDVDSDEADTGQTSGSDF